MYRETTPLGVLNSNPSPSTVSSEAATVPVSPAATGQVVFPDPLSINSSGYSTSPGSRPASVPTAAPVTTSPASGPASVPTTAPVTSELRPAATSTLAPHVKAFIVPGSERVKKQRYTIAILICG